MNIVTTGSYGTGSSAVIDLLFEVEGAKIAVKDFYEHAYFYAPDGLFELKEKLFCDSSTYISRDVALLSFYKCALNYYTSDYGWIGTFKKYIGEDFMKITDEFIKQISFRMKGVSCGRYQGTNFSLKKSILQIGARIVSGRKISKLGRNFIYDRSDMYYCSVDVEQFNKFARKYVEKFLALIGQAKFMIYDHLILPEQSSILSEYFDDNTKAIIVDRDPRDIYITAKYFWSQPKMGAKIAPFPLDIDKFCSYWKETRAKAAKGKDNKNIYNLQFEDLIYDYDNSIEKIFKFLDIKNIDHKMPKSKFDPAKSIHNTQVWKHEEKYFEEAKKIEELLPEYLYDFPYDAYSDKNKMFD